MKLQMSLNISDSKLFQKLVNELMSYYIDVYDDVKYRQQEEYVFSIFKKLIGKTNNEEKIVVILNQVTAFMIRVTYYYVTWLTKV